VRTAATASGPICKCYARAAMRISRLFVAVLLAAITIAFVGTAAQSRPPLAPADITAIATLLKLEDTRQFDDPVLAELLKRSHPEVRRRTVLAIGRIADARGKALLANARTEQKTD
jgi:hypothetical protein